MHGVVDGQSRVDLTAWAVDVHLDVAVRVLLSQVQQLGDDQIGDDVVDRRTKKHNSVLEQERKDVIPTFAAAGLLDDHGHRIRQRPHTTLSFSAFL